MAKKDTPDFEKTLEELEDIVQSLETGELSLEDSLTTFERGIKLTRQCQTALQEAEQRVTILLEKNGETVEEAFDTDNADNA
ncbi:MAG: exodeoxyribonuclease VII small subunit [Agarilytica sp.]